MKFEALRLLICSKLDKGRLPLNSIPRVWGGPGNGETCDACGGAPSARVSSSWRGSPCPVAEAPCNSTPSASGFGRMSGDQSCEPMK